MVIFVFDFDELHANKSVMIKYRSDVNESAVAELTVHR
jgi:hypothetical protein